MLSVLGDKPLAVWVVARLLKYAGLLEAYLIPASVGMRRTDLLGDFSIHYSYGLKSGELGSLRLYLTINAKS
jgi:hypothetical protein